MIDFDANFLVDVFRPRSNSARALARWVGRGDTLSISCVAWAEFLCGPVAAEDALAARGLVTSVEPLTETDAVLAAKLFNDIGRPARGFADCMIAALAIRRGVALATLDTTDFKRFKGFGLKLA